MLYSTRSKAKGVTRLTREVVQQHFSGALRIGVISPYYDVKWLLQLLTAPTLSNAQEVRLIFNILGASRLKQQVEELRGLESALKKRAPKCEINVRLAHAPGIFHTKLFLFQVEDQWGALVGSLNATNAATQVNEEILVSGTQDVELLRSYLIDSWTCAKKLDDLENIPSDINDLIAFFRTGILYFKPSSSLLVTYNPFRDLLHAIPEELRRRLDDQALPFSDPGGLGAFKVSLALNTVIEYDSEQDESKTRASLKPYSVETCLGYWVPISVESGLEKKLQEARSQKETVLKTFSKRLASTSNKIMLAHYNDYLGAAKERLLACEIQAETYLGPRRTNPFESQPAFLRLVAGLRKKLEDPNQVARMSFPYLRTPMPEIWSDPDTSRLFSESFFDYLSYVSYRSSIQRGIVKTLLVRIRKEAGDTPDQIKKALIRHLQNNGWPKEIWVRQTGR